MVSGWPPWGLNMPLPLMCDWSIGPSLEDGACPRMNGVRQVLKPEAPSIVLNPASASSKLALVQNAPTRLPRSGSRCKGQDSCASSPVTS